MRLFIALDVPSDLHPWLQKRREEWKHVLPAQGLRWTPPDQWHITLRFLGEFPEHRIPAIRRAMTRAAAEMSPFSMTLGKPGAFSGPRMGVLWVGVATGREAMVQLADHLNTFFDAESIPKDERLFRPHVTLARRRDKIPSAVLRGLPSSPPCPESSARSFHLYQSTLGPEGARYAVLHTTLIGRP